MLNWIKKIAPKNNKRHCSASLLVSAENNRDEDAAKTKPKHSIISIILFILKHIKHDIYATEQSQQTLRLALTFRLKLTLWLSGNKRIIKMNIINN